MKNQKGITLVALVVTIVVLLILAGITIAYVMQGDSIFEKAKVAASETNIDSVKTSVSMAILELQANYYDPSTASEITSANAVEKLKSYMPAGMQFTTLSFTNFDATDGTRFYFNDAKVAVTSGDTTTNYTVSYGATGLTVAKAS